MRDVISVGVRLVFLLALVACGHPAAPADHPQPAPAQARTGDPSCPVAVPGTSVTVEDTPTGASLVFVTTGDLADVRARAQAAVAGTQPAMWVEMVQTESAKSAHDIERGARVDFAAKPENVAALQSELRMHAQHLSAGTCKMAM